jgi:hypothetical protein
LTVRAYLLSLVGSVGLVAAAFLPWLRIGQVGLAGVPDPAGFFVAGLGVAGIVLSLVALRGLRSMANALFLVGLAAVTALAVVWWNGPAVVSERAHLRAQAVALVDEVALQQVPPVTVGSGLFVGVASALLVIAAGLSRMATARD